MRSLRRDGAALFYEEAQGDETPVLLVHGIGCDHTYFAPQFEHFARRGHRVVAVDLRGHGKSDKPEQSYTMQLFADDEPVRVALISSPSRPEVQSGTNTLNFGPEVSIVEVDGSSSGDTIRGQADADFLNGIQGNDTVRGRGGNDTVVGMEGKDTLFGGAGTDDIDAGPGADRIEAVDGEADTITCGAGEDTVFFDQGLDTILDPNQCEDQRPM
jgi:RTX calcium-binding nonapeptide repeat (4 copies)/alpha/beta hydrolase fold